jgi:ATP-binding cassette subfamily B protein
VLLASALLLARHHGRWTRERLSLTADLVEHMTGHRTRLVQERAESWHLEEDERLERYIAAARPLDRSLAWMQVIPRAWLLLAIAGMFPSVVTNQSVVAIAISAGGALLVQQALKRLSTGMPDLAAALSAWTSVKPLFAAASEPVEKPTVIPRPVSIGPVVNAEDLTFRYSDRAEAVLKKTSLRIDEGQKIVLEGTSGSGKSTLASILAGIRSADHGLLLLNGFDRSSLGATQWRRKAVLAPQFHENHILSESLAFNLLMGKAWPPTADDWREAEEICMELGLDKLLAAMPAGLSQMVGEQLSHGEKSRVFIARALLQEPEVVILDESFAALDAETLQRSLDCVTRRARAVMVIAHP